MGSRFTSIGGRNKGRVTSYNFGGSGGSATYDGENDRYNIPGGNIQDNLRMLADLQANSDALAGAINQAQDLDATRTFQDNVDFAVNNPAELTQEDYDKFSAEIGDIQRALLNPEQKKAAISQVLSKAGIYHDVASLDILGKGSGAGGLLSKRIKIVPPDSSGGGGDSTADPADTVAAAVNNNSADANLDNVLDAAGMSSAATVSQDNAGTMAKTVNPFEGNTGGELIFDGTNFVQNIEVDGDEYSRLVPDVLARQLQEAIAAETDPQQKAALTAELAKYMEGTGNTVDTVDPMIVQTYGIQTNTISPSQIANGSDVDWKEGDKIAVLGLSDDKYLLEHISSTTNQVGNKSKTKDEQMDEQINNFLNGRLNWADIKIIAEQIFGAGTQAANNAVITASEKAQEQNNKAAAQVAAGQQAGLANQANQGLGDGNTDMGLLGNQAAADGQLGSNTTNTNTNNTNTNTNTNNINNTNTNTTNTADPNENDLDTKDATCGEGTKLAGQLVPADGNCNPTDDPLDQGIDPNTGIGGGVGVGTGIGVGPGVGSGTGGGEGNSNLSLFQSIQQAPISLSLLDKSGLDFEPTPLLSRILKL